MQDNLLLPQHAGSLLRGQFGAALRRTACMTRKPTCAGCALLRTCPYPEIFETPPPAEHRLQKFSQVPNPYVIEPPPFGTRSVAAGDRLVFDIVLVGRAIERLALVVHAFRRALAQGLGRRRARGVLETVAVEDGDRWREIWSAGRGEILAHDAVLSVPAFADVRSATLRIVTPLRLQNDGRPLSIERLSPRALITNLMRRATLLLELH
ncbi:MAG: CRISPR-associated protein Cas6, partial [Casimicrobiaceae bacterium]|nr:CRISPR-associated protein Cas6 [Casimicrobiaceae bacterium]